MMSKTERRRMSSGQITASLLRTSADDTSEPSGFSFLRSNTFAGPRTIICSVGPDSIVVTPDSIPQFTIPRLAVEDRYTCTAEDLGTHPGEDTAQDQTHLLHQSTSSVSLSSSSSPFSSSPMLRRKAQRTISDPNYHRRTSTRCIPCSFTESDQCSDPVTRGALSLPHLAKITTPYGFVTLSQSPQMASEEELLLQIGCRSWARGKINMPFTNQRAKTESHSSGRSVSGQNHTNADSRQVSRGVGHSETSVSSSSFLSSATAGTKQSFWGLLREHLSRRKLTKSI